MDRNSVSWEGQFTAMVTPFDADGAIDEAGLRRQVDFLDENGVNVIVSNGCTGEFWTQTLDERKRVVSLTQQAAAGRLPIIAGCSANYTPHVIELAQHAKEAGCAGIMMMPPYLVRPNADDIFHHYKAVSDAVDIPILLYNIPRDTVNDLTPELVDRLADLRTVVAIKDSSFDFTTFYRLQTMVSERIRVLIGPSTVFGFAAVQLGADGWVDTYSNLWPQLTVELWHASRDGRTERAKELQRIGLEFRRIMTLNDRNMYSAVKACMNMKGLPGGFPRLPLRPLGEPHLSELREHMLRLGLPDQSGSMRQAAE